MATSVVPVVKNVFHDVEIASAWDCLEKISTGKVATLHQEGIEFLPGGRYYVIQVKQNAAKLGIGA